MRSIRSKYKSLLKHFLGMGSIIRELLFLARQKRSFESIDPIPELQHLSFSVRKSVRQVIVNREIDEKIKQGYFEDRLIIVAALPKSASSVIGFCIAAIQSQSGGVGKRRYATYMLANQDSGLRPELVQDFLQGGVLKFHPRATGKNLKVLDLLGVKHIILLRHPVDQLVATYCHYLDAPNFKEDLTNYVWIYDHIHPLDWRSFQEEHDPNEVIRHMILGGYLNAVLSWITDWLRFRDTTRSLVLRYEDFVMNRKDTLNNISNFLYGWELDEHTLMTCHSIAQKYVNLRTGGNNATKYPQGWTGKVGVWRSYLSDGNKGEYLSVVKGFLEHYPHASLILDVYPNLLDIDNR